MQGEIDIMEEFYKFNKEEDVMQSKSKLDVYLEESLHLVKEMILKFYNGGRQIHLNFKYYS